MIIIGFLLLFTTIKAQQNLVPNPGFDSLYSNCPLFSNNISNILYWYEYASIDPFYYCRPAFPVSNGIPINSVGNQFPLSDSIYIGCLMYTSVNIPGTIIYREYISTMLLSELKKNYTYCVEFYVSLADTADFGISSIGACLSVDSLLMTSGSNYLLNYVPQIQNDSLNIVVDKTNWVKISGSFVAQGGEQFLTIGNFYDDNYTERHYQKVSNNNIPFGSDFAYYYIDNVSVYACDSPLVEEPQDTSFVFIPNVFSPNQDGENDLWQVTAQKVNSLNIQVFNRWGEQVYSFNSAQLSTLDIQPSTSQLSTFNPAWDGYTPTGKPVPEGTYFYIIQYTLPSAETKVEKGYVTLVR